MTRSLSVSRQGAIHLSRKRARKVEVFSSPACGRGGTRSVTERETF